MMRSSAEERNSRKELIAELQGLRERVAALEAELAETDITERQKAEAALCSTEQRLRLFVEHAPASVAMFDRQMRYLVVSRRWLEDYRLGVRDIIGRSHYEVFPEIPERWKQIHRRCLAGAVERCEEDPFPRADGRTDWVRWEIHPWRHTAGEIGGIIMFTEVITARKEAEQALRESERRLNRAQEIAHVGSWELDLLTSRLVWSDEVYRVFGLQPQEFAATYEAFLNAVHPDDRAAVDAAYSGSLREGRDTYEIEHRVVRKCDGGVRVVHERCEHFRDGAGRIVRSTGMVQDITDRKRTEEALRESEAGLAAAQRLAHIGSWQWDISSNTAKWSDETFRIFGVARDQLQQHRESFVGMVHPEDRQRVDQALTDALNRTREYDLDYRIRLPDGSEKIIHSQAEVLRSDDSKPVLMRGTVQDITERVRTEEALRLTQFSVDRAADSVFWVDSEARLIYVNDTACQSLGYSREELLNMSIFDIDPIYPRDLWRRHWQELTRCGSILLETQHRRKNGEIFPIEVSARYVKYNDKEYDFAFVRDITERKRVQEALESANTAKDQFLAALSHELRTPLTPVLMLSQMLQDDPGLPIAARQDLKTIRQNVQLEARLIDDLLDLTRITRGKASLKPERVDVHELLRHAVQTCCDERFAEKRLKVHWQLSAASSLVSADPARLEQVFWNLINNAIKFTPPEGTITIRTSDLPDKRSRIQVTDTGRGIEPDKLTAIFNPFEQGGTETTGRYGGLGLGLAIAKAVTEMHGGAITATSDGPGRGATFTVVLPLADLQEPTAPVASAPAAPAQKPEAGTLRILLVEDHYTTAIVLGRLIQRWGWESSHAVSVKSALDLAAREHFDLVLSDLGLPDGTGHDLMRRLRDLYGVKGIALSGYGMEQDVQRSLESGFVLHLTKPVNFEELRAAIADFQASTAQKQCEQIAAR